MPVLSPENLRSLKGLMPSSLEMAKDSSNRAMALARSPSPFRVRNPPTKE